MNRYNPIGVFDSGIGGLTVVKKLSEFLPSEKIIYFGDTARVPYGSKSNETVIEYAKQAAGFLINKNVKLLVAACNTVSAVAIDALAKSIDIPIIGMIEPGVNAAIKTTKNKRIGVIGTYATIGNKAYSKKLLEIDASLQVFEKACPLFVPLAEEGLTKHKATYEIAEEYLKGLRENGIDALILGCTHYPILSEVIQETIGENVSLIDSGAAASFLVEDYLSSRGIKNPSNSIAENEYYVSDMPARFRNTANLFLGKPIEHIEKVDLEELRVRI